MKVCFKCFVEKPLSDFYVRKDSKDGRCGRCRECTLKRVSDYRSENIEKVREYDRNRPNQVQRTQQKCERTLKLCKEDSTFKKRVMKAKVKWIQENPKKKAAQNAANNAVTYGKLQKKTVCEHCNLEKKLQKHHWSYEEQHWLDVIWLCTFCHGKEHKRLNSIGRNPDTISQQQTGC